jgi:hypothetical protein
MLIFQEFFGLSIVCSHILLHLLNKNGRASAIIPA